MVFAKSPITTSQKPHAILATFDSHMTMRLRKFN